MDFTKLPVKECPGHKLPALVFKSPLKVYAGAGSLPTTPPEGAVILDLAGRYKPVITSTFPIPGVSPTVSIDWPDMGVPKLSGAEWRVLAKAIARTRRPLYVACLAGHGRTGTVLAILGVLLGAIPKGVDPVEAVRKLYDSKAVESEPQCRYIEQVTGVEVLAKGSQGSSGGNGGSKARLCPKKVDGDWCNLDEGHKGDCDTRHRRAIFATATTPKPSQPSLPPTVTAGITTTACVKCGGKFGHFSTCPIK